MDYNLTALGDREFEHLGRALCLKALGPGVTVFGDGPDGGREATCRAPIDWGTTPGGERWDGYTVVQAKLRVRPRDPADNLKWLLHEIDGELDRWTNERYRRARTAERPDNLLILTNVVLSSAQDGGYDTVMREIGTRATQKGLALKGYKVWSYDQLCALLDAEPGIRTTYGGFITSGDVLASLATVLRRDDVGDFGRALKAHAAKDLLAQQWVRLGQAGDTGDEKLGLAGVAVDVPARIDFPARSDGAEESRPVAVAAFLLERGELVLGRNSSAGPNPHVLLVGNAGQGKSTVSQLVCQVYRLALLRGAKNVSPEVARLLATLAAELDDIGLSLPHHRRWPFMIDLGEYGNRVLGGENVSLLRYMADKISARASVTVTSSQVLSWLRGWPSFLVLDGLDEVAAPSVRERITQAVSDFLVDAADAQADVLVVVTTRPQGYAGEFGVEHYQRLDMLPLEQNKAIECARRLGLQRLRDDDDLREKVLQRMTDASQDQDTRHLLTTPLQVTIMQLLLERRQRVPHDRFQLFQGYFETIYAREQNKPGYVGKLLEEHRGHVVAVHEQIALSLQRNAERYENRATPAPVARAVLEEVTRQRLQKEGYAEVEADRLTADLVRAATQRLVLLVPVLEGSIDFEVRSLREFMAARALTTGEDAVVLANLAVLSPSAHWRNTWLFAAGRLFSEKEHLRDSILTLIQEVDTDSLLALVVRPGAVLATALLEDDLAVRSPKYRRLLARCSVERLTVLPDEDIFDLGGVTSLGSTLFSVAEEDDIINALLRRSVEQAMFSEDGSGVTADWLLTLWRPRTGKLGVWARSQERKSFSLLVAAGLYHDSDATRGPKMMAYLKPFLDKVGTSCADKRFISLLEVIDLQVATLDNQGGAGDGLLRVSQRSLPDLATLEDVFAVTHLADAYASLVDLVASREPWVASALKSIASYWYWRRPVSDGLR